MKEMKETNKQLASKLLETTNKVGKDERSHKDIALKLVLMSLAKGLLNEAV